MLPPSPRGSAMKPRGLPSLIVLQGLTLRRGPLRPTFDRRGLNLKEKSVCVCSTAHGWPARNPSLSTLDLTSSRSRPSHRFTAEWLTLCQAANGVAADLHPTRRPYRRFHSGNRRTHPPPKASPKVASFDSTVCFCRGDGSVHYRTCRRDHLRLHRLLLFGADFPLDNSPV